ncbi:hypothetical protein FA95DRAFT_1494794 [Auriscalpium vulgare]|uniref:Uncharacterized protein n=1 Tax=Auriscalpium vulgare TaxID=40419 RepID=A0ACB8RPQ8_9AGAM|nr:hypothetical protein FA95DRAFT_1494794 [Auriscalpium vulgare]
MGYVRSRKFCCCLPVRFGVFLFTLLGIVGGGIVAAVGWHQTAHGNNLHLTKDQEISLVISSIAYTALAIISLFGLIGVIIKKKGFVSLYSTLVWCHLGVSIATGVYFIYTLFHQTGDKDINNCAANNPNDKLKEDACKVAFKVARGLTIGIYAVFWLVELWAAIIVADYVGQLSEEEEADWSSAGPPAVQAGASVPPMTTTYGSQYAFAAQDNSFGRASV